jgi:hypothetical protein
MNMVMRYCTTHVDPARLTVRTQYSINAWTHLNSLSALLSEPRHVITELVKAVVFGKYQATVDDHIYKSVLSTGTTLLVHNAVEGRDYIISVQN